MAQRRLGEFTGNPNFEKLSGKRTPQTREELIERLEELREVGWIKTRKQFNDGLVGNTLEDFLNIDENNLRLPDAGRYEIKAQSVKTSSLTTLLHYTPFPRGKHNHSINDILGPRFGWPHPSYKDEWSFRVTTSSDKYTNRGFKVSIDEDKRKLWVEFNPSEADVNDPKIRKWIDSVPEELSPRPYWKLKELRKRLEKKLDNVIYVYAKPRGDFEFKYVEASLYEGFDWKKFKKGLRKGLVIVDFDARTTHDHGTKFRVKKGTLANYYASQERVF